MSRAKSAGAAIGAAALAAILASAVLPALRLAAPAPTGPSWIGESLWVERSLDVAIQAFILLAGVFAILLLLREEPSEATP